MEGIWSLVTVVGPVLLIVAIVWAFLRNRRASRAEIERSEQGARRLREQLEREGE